jgi:dUTP pyrophosphatase
MKLRVFLHSELAKLPRRADDGAAGYDLTSIENITIPSRSRSLVSTGLSIQLPMYSYGRVAPRSGLSVKGIDVGAGVIDESYRGIVKVLLINNSENEFNVSVGDRIAQLLIEPIYYPDVDSVSSIEELSSTSRGSGGFGSTGLN